MAQRTSETNVVRVLKAVGETLKTITWNHATLDFFTNGMLVDYDVDPTFAIKDRIAEYDRLAVVASVLPGNAVDESVKTAGVKRIKYSYAITCMATLTPDDKTAGITLIAKQERIVADARLVLDTDYYLKAYAAANYADDAPVGQYMSCINHHITTVASDQGQSYPSINFDMICEFDYDVLIPPARPSSP